MTDTWLAPYNLLSARTYIFGWISLFAVVLFSLAKKRIRQRCLWKIPGPPSASFVTGNYPQMFNTKAAKFHEHIMQTYGRDTQLVISDPKTCTNILLKDQDVFEETDWFIETNRYTFGLGLLATLGAHHRKQRKQLNPVFSIKHMRSMVPLFHGITRQLCTVLAAKAAGGRQEIDMLEWLGRLALELIAQGGLGYTFNSLDPNSTENEFGRAIKEYNPTISRLATFRKLFPLISRWPAGILRFGAKVVPFPMLHNLIRVTGVMRRYTREVFDEKKRLLEKGDEAFAQQLSEGNDIISVLMKSNSSSSAEDRLSDEEILGQMTTLIFAATDTTSTALSRILHLLALHQDVQEALRQELIAAHAAAGDTELGYDELVELPYLEAICRETLRLYPPANFVYRMARADISVPLSQPLQTPGGALHSLFVPRGTTVMVAIGGVNRDPTIWGVDAAEWKPARWRAPLPESVADARVPGVYSNTLTFLGGGRACIGFKFSQLEMKVALSQLLRAFRFLPAGKEIVWRFGGITTPSVEGATAVMPQMPLAVERA
ncbi:cytochrome P450 [Artomyces pyxidatus]|uniref:Cytochrome P450 n=1 Tax=Artomyces pyxidatus TaxID=48021 RepID=A0ACB8SU97_9AGAM|nr:cytochrome P450 [Artomyces pyxidatus]